MEDTFFYHKNKPSDRNKATFAGVVSPEDKQLRVGISRCNSKDDFNKELGRAIAKGRACKRPADIISLEKIPQRFWCDIFVEYCKALKL